MALHAVNILSLCSGIGGLDLGLKRAVGPQARVVAHVEGEMYAAAVLAARMQDGAIHDAPIWSDVKTFNASAWRGCVDILTAGYPCQPFSAAGKRRGTEDPRHLWPYIAAHIQAIRPTVVFCENVPGHITLGFEQVCQDLSAMGYAIEAGIFSAAEIGAPHLRKRLFFLAYADRDDLRKQFGRRGQRPRWQDTSQLEQHGGKGVVADTERQHDDGRANDACISDPIPQLSQRIHGIGKEDTSDATARGRSGIKKHVANANGARPKNEPLELRQEQKTRIRLQGPTQRRLGRAFNEFTSGLDHNPWFDGWEDSVPRVTAGQPHRVDRLRALGNAVVPGVASLAWNTLVHQALSRATIAHAQVKNAVST